MIYRTQEKHLNKGRHPCQFPINLPVPEPFGKEEYHPAAKGNSGIKCRWSYHAALNKGCQNDRSSHQMYCPNDNGYAENPKRSIANSTHLPIPAPVFSGPFNHFYPSLDLHTAVGTMPSRHKNLSCGEKLAPEEKKNSSQKTTPCPQIIQGEFFFQVENGKRHKDKQCDNFLEDFQLPNRHNLMSHPICGDLQEILEQGYPPTDQRRNNPWFIRMVPQMSVPREGHEDIATTK